MAYILRGKLCGLICSECPEPLSNVIVRLYRSRDAQNVTALAVANPKETFAILTEEQVKENLMFGSDKTGELMKAAMTREDGRKWFGTPPPDLSLIARSRGPNWFYTYRRSFYRDDKSSTGWNNTVFPSVAMPHVLHDVQGVQRAVYRTEKREIVSVKDGQKLKKVTEEQVFDRFEIEKPGSMTTQQYDDSMRDLTNFMVYVGEPAKLVRYRLGIYVLVFLAIFLVVAYLLKKEYWKDVH